MISVTTTTGETVYLSEDGVSSLEEKTSDIGIIRCCSGVSYEVDESAWDVKARLYFNCTKQELQRMRQRQAEEKAYNKRRDAAPWWKRIWMPDHYWV